MLKIGFVYLFAIVLCYLLCRCYSADRAARSLRVAGRTLARILPLLLAIFALIGLFQVFVPADLVQHWLGGDSRLLALLVGGGAGAIAIGPPLAAFPLAGSLLDAGAWPPAVAAFIVSWISVGVITLPFEAEVFGVRFALLRNGLSLLLAMLVGVMIGALL